MGEFICVDGKCIYARVSWVMESRPLYASSYYGQVKPQLSVYCMKKHRIITKPIRQCVDFQNTTLTCFP
jgi:hypothetical protein